MPTSESNSVINSLKDLFQDNISSENKSNNSKRNNSPQNSENNNENNNIDQSIESPRFAIKGNLIIFKNTIIRMENISCVSKYIKDAIIPPEIPKPTEPSYNSKGKFFIPVCIIIIGCLFLFWNGFISIISILLGIFLLGYQYDKINKEQASLKKLALEQWEIEKQKREQYIKEHPSVYKLNIGMNSGQHRTIHFKDKEFLIKVYNELKNIFESGNSDNNQSKNNVICIDASTNYLNNSGVISTGDVEGNIENFIEQGGTNE